MPLRLKNLKPVLGNERLGRAEALRAGTQIYVRFLSLTLLASVGGRTCKTDADCNYAGVCNSSHHCSCDVSWAGERCQRLNLLPAASTAVFPPNANTAEQDVWTWGGAAITDDDGRVHMFVTEWLNHCPMDYPSFATQTHIIHVVAETADGPFERVREGAVEVVPDAAGNPVVSRATDGTYLLHFTNYRYDGPVNNCTNGDHGAARAAANRTAANRTAANRTAACGIHLAHSRDLRAWEIVYDIAYGSGGGGKWDNCTLTNPGPFVFPNSSVLMMFKLCRYPPYCASVGGKYDGAYITGLLASPVAPDAHGTPPYLQPYTRRVRDGPLINTSKGNSIEDPSNGWMDGRGRLHMLVHVGQNEGGSMHSVDGGVDWHFNLSDVSYPAHIAYADGSVVSLAKRQEPKVLLGPDGLPTHLINICGTGKHGFGHTYVCLQPICTHTARRMGRC